METDSYQEIGDLLSRARRERNLAPEQVAQLLHMRLRYIEAMEEGRFTDLPGLTYTRGYLQAYATFVGLDKDEILRRFEQVAGGLARRGFYFPQVFSGEKHPEPIFVWGGLFMSFTVYVLWLVAQPAAHSISIIERFPERKAAPAHLSAAMLADVACLQEQDVLYPPCYTAQNPRFSLIPLQGQPYTIMQLAIVKK